MNKNNLLSGLNNYWVKLTAVAAVCALVSFGLIFSLADRKKPAPCQATVCVALKADKADPDTITVQVGTEVQFNSADGKSHSLSLGKGGQEHGHTGKFQSGTFKEDEAWRTKFEEEGTYFFHDHFNPKINVLVIVYTPGKDYKIQ